MTLSQTPADRASVIGLVILGVAGAAAFLIGLAALSMWVYGDSGVGKTLRFSGWVLSGALSLAGYVFAIPVVAWTGVSIAMALAWLWLIKEVLGG